MEFVESLPHTRGGAYDWAEAEAKCREHPGEWLRIDYDVNLSVVNAVRDGRIVRLHKDKGFRVTTRDNKPGPPRTATLFLMYDPDQEKEDG